MPTRRGHPSQRVDLVAAAGSRDLDMAAAFIGRAMRAAITDDLGCGRDEPARRAAGLDGVRQPGGGVLMWPGWRRAHPGQVTRQDRVRQRRGDRLQVQLRRLQGRNARTRPAEHPTGRAPGNSITGSLLAACQRMDIRP